MYGLQKCAFGLVALQHNALKYWQRRKNLMKHSHLRPQSSISCHLPIFHNGVLQSSHATGALHTLKQSNPAYHNPVLSMSILS